MELEVGAFLKRGWKGVGDFLTTGFFSLFYSEIGLGYEGFLCVVIRLSPLVSFSGFIYHVLFSIIRDGERARYALGFSTWLLSVLLLLGTACGGEVMVV